MNAGMIEWVKVEERLPDFEEEILICDNGKVTSAELSQKSNTIFRKAIESNYNNHEYFYNVTHWAYFPDPPNDIDS